MVSNDNVIEKASKYIGRFIIVGDTKYKFSHISPRVGVSERSEFDVEATTTVDKPVAILVAQGKSPIMKSLQEIIGYFERSG